MGARHQRTQRAPQHAHECQRRRLAPSPAPCPPSSSGKAMPATSTTGSWCTPAGRPSRHGLGFAGFDGGRATVRDAKRGLEATGYVGVGLARASSVGSTTWSRRPLGDFIPGERNLLAGVLVGLDTQPGRGARTVAAPGGPRHGLPHVRLPDGKRGGPAAPPFALAGGLDYDLAQGWVGSADAEVRYHAPRVYVTAGYKRYMPRFDLWTSGPRSRRCRGTACRARCSSPCCEG